MSETARLLDDTAHRILTRALGDPHDFGSPAKSAIVLDELGRSGLPLVMVSEAQGGLGAGLAEATTLAWRVGWHAAPVPIVPMLLCPALSGDTEALRIETTLANRTDLHLSDGVLGPGRVEAAATADTRTILVVCTSQEGPCLAELAADQAERFHTIDGQLRLSLDPNRAHLVGTRPSPIAPAQLARQAALLTAAAMVGAMARQLDIVIEHANTRTQFGRPLAKFQAVQNLIVGAASEYVVAQAALAGAVAAEDGGWGHDLHWRAAKVQASRAATIVTAAAHQVLGAIGFTEEHFLHRLSKRLWVLRDEWGRETVLERAIGTAACRDPRGLLSHIVDSACEETR